MTLENLDIEALCSYFAQYDVSLPSGNTLRCGIFAKFDDEMIKMQQFFQSIKVLLMCTTTNHVAIVKIMIHWIDDMCSPHQCLLPIKELLKSHGGAHMAKVLHELQFFGNNIMKIIFLETREKEENFDIRLVILERNWI